ncbi:NUDIX hydrolase [Streptomyces yaizuensis]|uniref:NUDIX domain-containing protein n=1 Tax=Streptomyces yaizuensis TaxID=2989713 RepID=A0ABQ5P127_9ACTN|nr:NUDIX domain-containing protein [Streptomyces sp. YSPA8]GLF96202.1 NUDIX domain-containing protein [Streptomyces sp. YSPA8]
MGAADELLDVVDAEDRVVGVERRGEVYARGLRHRCAFILVTNAAGEIFVHRRTAGKLVFPSRYAMFTGGVVGTGESYDDAAWREAREELGAPDLPRPTPLFRFLYEEEDRSWWSAVYQVRCDIPVRPQAEEVAWWAFLPPKELERRLTEWEWVPDGLAAYRLLTAHQD